MSHTARLPTAKDAVFGLVLLCACSSVDAQLDQPFPAVFDLGSIETAQGGLGFVLNGIDRGDASGVRVSSAGDLNADGIPDLIVGAYYADRDGDLYAGECYVVFGGSAAAQSGTVDLALLDGRNGFVLRGVDSEDFSGSSLGWAGDLNADGIDDVVIGAPWADVDGEPRVGETYVIFGGKGIGSSGVIDLGELDGTDGFVIRGLGEDDRSGAPVSRAGDVNADGVSDLIIGAAGDAINRSGCYVLFGRPGIGSSGAFDPSTLDGSNGFVISGFDGRLGFGASSAGDFNSDGVSDLVIGSSFSSPDGRGLAGRTYVVFGDVDVGRSGSLDLTLLNGTDGFVLNGIDPGDRSGIRVASAGDVNADGVSDLIIGAPNAVQNGQDRAGESYVVFGGADVGSTGTVELHQLDGSNGFVLRGFGEDALSGQSVSSAGDVNADGMNDLIIGAWGADPLERTDAGASYVLYGRPGIGASGTIDLAALDGSDGFILAGAEPRDRSGVSATSAGDVNADGVTDLIIGAYRASPNGRFRAGASYVVYGRQPVNTCPADTSGDGVLSPTDLDSWIVAYYSQAQACDQNGDGLCTPADFNAWILNYNAGCP